MYILCRITPLVASPITIIPLFQDGVAYKNFLASFPLCNCSLVPAGVQLTLTILRGSPRKLSKRTATGSYLSTGVEHTQPGGVAIQTHLQTSVK